MKRKLTDSFIYTELLRNNLLDSKLKGVNPVLARIPDDRLEEPLETIKKKFNFDLKGDILELYNDKKIFLIMNIDKPIPRYINVFGKIVNGKPVTVIDLSAYGKLDSNGNINIFPRTLYGLMQNALVLYTVTTKFSKIERNTPLAVASSAAYAKMFCHVLDKILGININPIRSDISYFLVTKFFLKCVYGYEDDQTVISEIARNNTINKTELETLLEMEQSLNLEKLYNNFMDFCRELSNLEGFKRLNGRNFIDNYLQMYGEASMLSIDYLPSFISVVLGTNVAAQINKDYIIDSICGKENKKVSLEFAKIV